MAILRSDLPAMHQGAQSLRDLIVGHQNKLAEQQNQADVDVGKAGQMLPVEQQAYQNKADTDVAKEGAIQERGMKNAVDLRNQVGRGGKTNVSLGAGGAVSIADAPVNPLEALRTSEATRKQAVDYSKRLEKQSGFMSALSEVEDASNKDGKGGVLTNGAATLDSTGGLKSAVPDSMMGLASFFNKDAATQMNERKGLQRLQNEYIKAMSGARPTEGAVAREKAAMGWIASGDPALVSKGVRALAHNVKHSTQVIQGGYSPEARDQVHSMSGDPMELYSKLYDDNVPGQSPGAGGQREPQQAGGLDPVKAARLAELRAKKAARNAH